MRTIKQYLEAAKARRENGEAGFSLVELIVVVVILGILAAVAIPIFNGIQQKAEENALAAIVGNGASQVASGIAIGETDTDIKAAVLALGEQSTAEIDGIALAVDAKVPGEALAIDNFCVTGTADNVKNGKDKKAITSGPGC